MPLFIYKNGKDIVDQLGSFEGKKIITYEISDFIGGTRHIPRFSKGEFEMQDKRVTSMKHFNICKVLGRYKGVGKLSMKIEGKEDVFEWIIRDGGLKKVKRDLNVTPKIEIVKFPVIPTVT